MSLRTRYITFACSIAVIAALLLGGYNFYWVNRLTQEQAFDRLSDDARAVATQVESRYNRLRNDATAISQTPPFLGMIRSMENAGVDPLDGSTTALWRERLQTIFKAIMRRRPEYVQMRYIEVADKGMELVRVDNRDGVILSIPGKDLQQKQNAPYVVSGILLSPYGVHFSNIDQNVEHGVPDPNLYVLRVVTQVRDPQGALFGLMVISTDFEAEIDSVLRAVDSPYAIYVVDDSGNYIERYPDGTITRIVAPYDSEYALPARFSGSDTNTGEFNHPSLGQVLYSRADVGFDVSSPHRRISIFIAAPKAEGLAGAQEIQKVALGLSLVLVLVTAGGAFAVARRMTMPMKVAVERIEDYATGVTSLDLPTHRKDEIGDLSRAFTSLVDSLEEARSEERAILARLEAIADNTVEGLITTDELGTILSFNRGAETMFGYTQSEAVGKPVDILMSTEYAERHDESLARYKLTGESEVLGKALEREGMRKDGTEFPIELTISEVRVNGMRIFSGIARDISERKLVEQQLIATSEALQKSNNDLEEFAYIASHDLKEPIRAISNHAQFLGEDHGDALGDDGMKRLDRIRDLCAKSERLVSDLLYFSRIGRGDDDAQSIDPSKTIDAIKSALVDYLAERKATIDVVTDLPLLAGDPSRIKSVFQNLIVNGVKYNDRDEKRIEIGYEEPVGDEPGKFYVKDNGIGIPDEFQERVFTIFKRLHNDRAYGPGSGAGLSFVRKIVERHGGKITVESREGEGSKFIFSLTEAMRSPES
ncbi:PAS domain S-box protein [Hwanghaeella grinnelliae]|uniref:histidine kinase n=1 Tax=Hwanghaeella grinnelliae TaxID=2500179 RepID=A0A3S2Y335_9PROT|nr:PAS domain S-box protein [Hwanghaeella grinnelliae]RVU36591.1 PAS domain S-box protein [Hwanghaeella grinnelliae]